MEEADVGRPRGTDRSNVRQHDKHVAPRESRRRVRARPLGDLRGLDRVGHRVDTRRRHAHATPRRAPSAQYRIPRRARAAQRSPAVLERDDLRLRLGDVPRCRALRVLAVEHRVFRVRTFAHASEFLGGRALLASAFGALGAGHAGNPTRVSHGSDDLLGEPVDERRTRSNLGHAPADERRRLQLGRRRRDVASMACTTV